MDTVNYDPKKHTLMPGQGSNMDLYLPLAPANRGEMFDVNFPAELAIAYPGLLPTEMFEIVGQSGDRLLARRLLL